MCRDWENSQTLADSVNANVNGDADAHERFKATKEAFAIAHFTTPWVARWVEFSKLSLVVAIIWRMLALPMKPLWIEGPMTGLSILLVVDEFADILTRAVEYSLAQSARDLHLHALVVSLEIIGGTFDVVSAVTYSSGSADTASVIFKSQLVNICKTVITLVALCHNTRALFRAQHHLWSAYVRHVFWGHMAYEKAGPGSEPRQNRHR